MSDERPIEKLLHRYAEKRRDAAGAPVELHPATRRMLQGEVARQFPKRAVAGDGEPTTFAQILKNWQMRWIWALPVLIVLGVGVWALVGTKEESSHGFDLAKNAAVPATPAEVAKRTMAEEAVTLRDEKMPTKGLAFSAPAKNDLHEDFDSLRKGYISADKGRLALAPASKPAEFAPEESVGFYRQEARGGGEHNKIQACSQAFANRASASSQGKIAKFDGIAPVLANFQVEQYGNQLRVIDGDGSTYFGEMESQATAQSVIVASEIKGAERLKLKQEDKPAVGRLGVTPLPEQEDMQNFAYRVAGTNRTLNRQVVFAWNFVPLTNELAAAQVKAPGRGGNVWQNNLPAQQFPLLLNNSFINGRAQVSGAKNIEINAVPVSP